MLFKKICFAGTALIFSSGLALGADLAQPVYSEPFEPAPLPPAGFYASLHAGYVMPEDGEAEFIFGGSTRTGDVDVEDGYRVGGSVGYDFNSMIGLEAEVSFSQADVDSIYVSSLPVTIQTGGDASILTLMGNVIVGQQYGRWRPYVGVGAGAGHVALDIDFTGSSLGIDDNDWAFAGQAFAGLDFDVTEMVSLGARYRYQRVGSTDYKDTDGDPVSVDSFGNHSIDAVLKVKFGG
tara:strand:+ start:99 stop:806 length:708 start_codon:yes stop_codon:yes gene_type:complete